MILFDSAYHPPRGPGHHTVVVPPRLEGKTALLEFLRETVPLPDYFGGNWDALEECLGDPDVLRARVVALVHHDLPLESEPDQQRIYLQILGAAAEDSPRLHAVFPHDYREQVLKVVG
ncbi:MAG: barstar family protein [Verrucomicrobiota bacterium]